jgi:hypothetical protein
MLTGLEGAFCKRISGCCRRGMDLLAENSCERTGGVCSTLLMTSESASRLAPGDGRFRQPCRGEFDVRKDARWCL